MQEPSHSDRLGKVHAALLGSDAGLGEVSAGWAVRSWWVAVTRAVPSLPDLSDLGVFMVRV